MYHRHNYSRFHIDRPFFGETSTIVSPALQHFYRYTHSSTPTHPMLTIILPMESLPTLLLTRPSRQNTRTSRSRRIGPPCINCCLPARRNTISGMSVRGVDTDVHIAPRLAFTALSTSAIYVHLSHMLPQCTCALSHLRRAPTRAWRPGPCRVMPAPYAQTNGTRGAGAGDLCGEKQVWRWRRQWDGNSATRQGWKTWIGNFAHGTGWRNGLARALPDRWKGSMGNYIVCGGL
ncbi:hypothetical protein EDB85DRAFT_1961604, partial [Lactarius pseudohatsudake]